MISHHLYYLENSIMARNRKEKQLIEQMITHGQKIGTHGNRLEPDGKPNI